MASRDLLDAHPYLQWCVPKLCNMYTMQYPNRIVRPICVYRSPEEQWDIYQIGRTRDTNRRTLTNIDGKTRLSNHNYKPALAVDLGVFTVEGEYLNGDTPKEVEAYDLLRPFALHFALVWGGDWLMKDRPHVELPQILIDKFLKNRNK